MSCLNGWQNCFSHNPSHWVSYLFLFFSKLLEVLCYTKLVIKNLPEEYWCSILWKKTMSVLTKPDTLTYRLYFIKYQEAHTVQLFFLPVLKVSWLKIEKNTWSWWYWTTTTLLNHNTLIIVWFVNVTIYTLNANVWYMECLFKTTVSRDLDAEFCSHGLSADINPAIFYYDVC